MDSGLERKRRRQSEDSEREETHFGSSKKVVRSPTYYKRKEEENKSVNEGDMEELKELLLDMKSTFTAEIRELKEDLKRREDKWDKERKQLETRITVLESKVEKQERDRRRNNIVIKGMEIEDNQIKEGVEQLVKDKLNIEVKVKHGYSVKGRENKKMLIVEMNAWGYKKEIMDKKGLLKGTKIYIDNDETLEERKIQAELRSIAREERKKGKEAKVGYQKIFIDGERYDWDPTEEGVVKTRSKN